VKIQLQRHSQAASRRERINDYPKSSKGGVKSSLEAAPLMFFGHPTTICPLFVESSTTILAWQLVLAKYSITLLEFVFTVLAIGMILLRHGNLDPPMLRSLEQRFIRLSRRKYLSVVPLGCLLFRLERY
jgi:hypothetical protein